MNIEVLGPRGVGKTSLAKQLASNYEIEYISLGKIARSEIREGTLMGQTMQYYIDNKLPYPQGFLVPLISQKLEQATQNGGFILDGYPRQATEAEELNQILRNIGISLDIIIELQAGLEDIFMRVDKRLICSNCDYQLEIGGDNTECPHCNGALIRRYDDTPEALERAYNLHLTHGEAIINILTAETTANLFRVDGRELPSVITTSMIYNINQLSSTT